MHLFCPPKTKMQAELHTKCPARGEADILWIVFQLTGDGAMGKGILVCGLNGAGKSTLGKYLAEKMNYRFMDIEDYFFSKTDKNYIYAAARTQKKAIELLLKDMRKDKNFVLAAVKADYGQEVASFLNYAVYVTVPKAIRMKRVEDRALQKFGDRVCIGGDLHEKEKRFFDMVEQRPENYVGEWLETIGIPIVKVDGLKPIEYNTEVIMQALHNWQE